MTRLPLVPLAAISLGLGIVACGDSGGRAHPALGGPARRVADSAGPGGVGQGPPRDRDGDRDNSTPESRYDADDGAVLNFGHKAGTVDRMAIATLVKRYYVAAAAANGAEACALVYSLVAESLAEEYGQLPALRGETCPVVLSKLFGERHRQLAAEAAVFKVIRVRVEGARGIAIVRFGTFERQIAVRHEGAAWKVYTLGEVGLP